MTVLDLINYLEHLPDTMKVKIEGTCTWCGSLSYRDANEEMFLCEGEELVIYPPNVDNHHDRINDAL